MINEDTQQNQDSEDIVNTAPANNNSDEGQSRFKNGQSLNFIRVRFPGHAKSYPFHIGKKKFRYGEKVIAMSDRGMAMGYINSFPYEVTFKESMLPVRTISKTATDEDVVQNEGSYDKEREAEELCISLVKKHNLDMDVTHVEFTQYGKKAVFYFVAPERVDFRGLVKDLVTNLKMRIELRQISIRDRAAALGGIGPCGRQLCCSSFLSNYGKVNIKMAKNQNLTLIPTRLNGLCGQLKCCTSYENDVYNEKRKVLPKEGTFIQVKNNDKGKVLKLHILVEQFDMLTDDGKLRRYSSNQFDKALKTPEGWSFPTRFEHITNEYSTVIGLTTDEQEQSYKFLDSLNEDGKYNEYLNSEEGDDIGADDEVILDDEEAPKTSKKSEVKSKDHQSKKNYRNKSQNKDKRPQSKKRNTSGKKRFNKGKNNPRGANKNSKENT